MLWEYRICMMIYIKWRICSSFGDGSVARFPLSKHKIFTYDKVGDTDLFAILG
jgi:hypothetical protein